MQERSPERVPRCEQAPSPERSPSPPAQPARAAAQANEATPFPPPFAAPPPVPLSSRWGVLADLGSADGLTSQTQDRAELGAAHAQSDAVQKALSVLKLGVLPILFAWMAWVPKCALVSGLMYLTGMAVVYGADMAASIHSASGV